MTHTICWVDIPVLNLDRAIRFYSAVLGNAVSKESAPAVEFGLLPHSNNNVSGCLCLTDDNRPSENGSLIYLSVEGRLDDAIQAVEKNGGKISRARHVIQPHGYRALVLDSEGNRVALHSQAP